MALNLDTSKQFRSVGELADLVRAISLAPKSESEPDWLEWKREADLNERSWQVKIAKCLAGFSNREPIEAKKWAGGCSYLVLGVEPGKVSGVAPVDNAILQAGISRFLGQSVRWSPQYIQHKGHQVLVLVVEPPEHGDQIVAMLTSYQSNKRGESICRKGDVFIRRHGSTDLAGQNDYDMLVRRFAGGAERATDISVQLLKTVTAVAVECRSEEIEAVRCGLERNLLAPLRSASQETSPLSLLASMENRSPDDYRREVASFVTELVPLLPSLAQAMALENRAAGMQLILENGSEHNFADVRVQVVIEGNMWAYRSAEDAQPRLPNAPRKWGSRTVISMPTSPIIRTPNLYGPHIDNSGSSRIEFNDVDLRPSAREELCPIYLVCDAKLEGTTLTANWTATSSSASGVVRGEFPIEVSSRVISLQDLFKIAN